MVILIAIPIFMKYKGVYSLKPIDYVLLVLNMVGICYTAIQGWRLFMERIRDPHSAAMDDERRLHMRKR